MTLEQIQNEMIEACEQQIAMHTPLSKHRKQRGGSFTTINKGDAELDAEIVRLAMKDIHDWKTDPIKMLEMEVEWMRKSILPYSEDEIAKYNKVLRKVKLDRIKNNERS